MSSLITKRQHGRSLLMSTICVHLHLQLGGLEFVKWRELLHVDLLDVGMSFVGFGVGLAHMLTSLAWL